MKNRPWIVTPFLRNSNVTRPYFRMKKQTHSLLVEEKETTRSNYWKPPLLASIAKSILCPKQNKKQRTNSWMKTWPKDTSYRLTRPMDSRLLWSLKRTRKRRDISSTTALSTPSLGKMSPHSLTLHSALKTYKEWRSSASLTSGGATTTFESMKATSGKAHSRQEEDYSNPKLCSLECPTHQPASNDLSTTKLWK